MTIDHLCIFCYDFKLGRLDCEGLADKAAGISITIAAYSLYGNRPVAYADVSSVREFIMLILLQQFLTMMNLNCRRYLCMGEFDRINVSNYDLAVSDKRTKAFGYDVESQHAHTIIVTLALNCNLGLDGRCCYINIILVTCDVIVCARNESHAVVSQEAREIRCFKHYCIARVGFIGNCASLNTQGAAFCVALGNVLRLNGKRLCIAYRRIGGQRNSHSRLVGNIDSWIGYNINILAINFSGLSLVVKFKRFTYKIHINYQWCNLFTCIYRILKFVENRDRREVASEVSSLGHIPADIVACPFNFSAICRYANKHILVCESVTIVTVPVCR